ncbi:cell wall hydrolase [Sphingomonas sp.]|uniref:cell wall hydrolase n=1 Tax=Sphingomonas sp. TaxID=28214 RepID=UPI002D7F60A9|nr:cell wall hydrolase [Sphingomonas sp.]HEU0043491.1 cell wall hydrolase [Sphingomonas sp.]
MRITSHRARLLLRGWLLLVFAGLGVTGAMATSAAWQALSDHSAPLAVAASAGGFEADDHFPGAALLYLEDASALPMPGTTGTIALPPVPVHAAEAPIFAEQGIVPARPFSMAAASGLDRARAMECLTTAIYYEAASEPDSGQLAVAQVILNRARHPVFPETVCGVVYQGSGGPVCQFSFACDGAMTRVPSRTGWMRAARNAAAALGGYVHPSVGLATHYHTFAVTPSWNRTLVMTDVIGAHFFHRWKGYWGTGAAFRQGYRGGEPVPGPVTRSTAAPMAATAAATTPAPIPVSVPSTILPVWRETGVLAAPAPTEDRLPPASQVLDRWKDSGKPL